MKRFLALAVLVVLFGVSCAPDDQPLPGPIEVRATIAEISGGKLQGLKLRGTVALWSAHEKFGGFSGLQIRDGRMLAVSDTGWLLEADLVDVVGGQRVDQALFRPLLDRDGRRFTKNAGDAEGLTYQGDRLWVSFERDHRLVHYADARPKRAIRDHRFATMFFNSGFEALATLPDGRLIAIAEDETSDGFPVFVAAAEGPLGEGRLPSVSRHEITGADIGPDGRLYLVLRDFIPFYGLSIRIQRYRLSARGLPDPTSREELAAFDEASGVDNMEGLAIWTDRKGRVRLTLISDDNYNSGQRTLVMDFEVLPDPPERHGAASGPGKTDRGWRRGAATPHPQPLPPSGEGGPVAPARAVGHQGRRGPLPLRGKWIADDRGPGHPLSPLGREFGRGGEG